ncbi:flavodoxin family protein [Chloroflexota bacterium]
MKGIICYYSGSGNTRLAVNYIKKRTKNADFELCNIVKNNIPDLSKYDIVGFATFTNFGGVSQYFHSFFDKINQQPNTHCFVFNTHGFMPIKTLKSLAKLAQSKGFNVLIGHSLHAPESYIPMRARNRDYDNSPNQKELGQFDAFISRLDDILESIRNNKIPKKTKVKIGLLGTIMPIFSPTRAKIDMG